MLWLLFFLLFIGQTSAVSCCIAVKSLNFATHVLLNLYDTLSAVEHETVHEH